MEQVDRISEKYSGILLVDKPVGPTSFSVVSRVRRIFGEKKVGHCGTLDPFASGLLPICIGRATRVIRYMDAYDKEYRCTARFGASTDTQDTEGIVTGGRIPTSVELEAMKANDFEDIRTLIEGLPGDHMQLPPMYSAIKVKGRPLYDYARSGVEIERETRQIRILYARLHACRADDGLTADFTIGCSKGTYIRTICDMLGEKTGFGAHAQDLRRTRCGPFCVEKAYTLEQLECIKADGGLSNVLLPESMALSHLPTIPLSTGEARDISTGKLLDLEIFFERLRDAGPAGSDTRYCAKSGDTPVAIVYPGEKDARRILRIERMLA